MEEAIDVLVALVLPLVADRLDVDEVDFRFFGYLDAHGNLVPDL